MKKSIAVLTLVATMSLAASQVFAWGPGAGCWGNGVAASEENAAQYQDFLDQTADLRRQVVLDRAELAAVMHQDNPDQEQARALAERIYDAQEAIRAKAVELGVAAPGVNCPGGCGGFNGISKQDVDPGAEQNG